MKTLSKRPGRVRRLLLTSAIMLISIMAVYAGILAPSLDKLGDCTSIQPVTGAWLEERSTSGRLALSSEASGRDSSTAIMLREHGLAGVISENTVFSEDLYLPGSVEINFTGVVYIRDAGLLEVWLGGVEDRHYYEVQLNNQTWLLIVSAFELPPFKTCL